MIKPQFWSSLFDAGISDWLRLNFKSKIGNKDCREWNLVFGAVIWLI